MYVLYNFVYYFKRITNLKIKNKPKLWLCLPGVGGFLPAMKQIGNVAALPGIVHVSVNAQQTCGCVAPPRLQ